MTDLAENSSIWEMDKKMTAFMKQKRSKQCGKMNLCMMDINFVRIYNPSK